MFLIAEHRQQRPMLDLTLFRRPAFAGASIVAFAVSASMFSMFLYLTLYIQDVLGYGPLQAGLRFLPITLLIVRRRAHLGQTQRAHAGAPAAGRRACCASAPGCSR